MYREIEIPSSVPVQKVERYIVFNSTGMGLFPTHNVEGAKLHCDALAMTHKGEQFTVIHINGVGAIYSSVVL